jgi:hypothetical protein|tara:strand:- start:1338 stop:2381 length:1044 start_codon:yes stop_codon:yes gene_type:complete
MSKKLWSDHKNMKSLMEGWRGFVNEEEPPTEAEEAPPEEEPEQASGGSWPSDAPKTVKITAGSNLSDEEILGVWKKLSSMNPPNDPDEILQSIGGPEALISNVKQLEKSFAASSNNPARIKMPVVDPGKDMSDLKGRLATGKLDVKAPFADWDEVEGEAETTAGLHGSSRKGRTGKTALDPNKRARVPKRSLAAQSRLRESEEEFPTDLVDDSDPVQDAYLTKGLRDGNKTDDSAVTLDPTLISVAKSFPTQSEVYLDKSIFNIMNFGPTKVGGTAYLKKGSDPTLIAIQDGGNNFILDGHHRWSSTFISGGPTASINVQALKGLDVATAIEALRSYGNARDNQQKS